MIQLPELKRGDTFSMFMALPPWMNISELRSQIRSGSGSLVANVEFRPVDEEANLYQILVMDTTDWQPTVYMDIRRTSDDGFTVTSETIKWSVVGAVTQTIDEFYNTLTSEINAYKDDSHRIEFDSNFQEVQRTGKIILDGSLNWTSPVLFQTNVYRAWVTSWTTANPSVPNAVGSNHINWNDLQTFQTVDAIDGSLPNRYQLAVHTNGNLYISIDKDYIIANGLTTAAALKTWLNAHPISFVYERVTPITQAVSVSITTNGQPDTSLRSFGAGTMVTVDVPSGSTVPTLVMSYPVSLPSKAVRAYVGGAWKVAVPKRFNGSSWVPVKVRVYKDGEWLTT